ncbi:pyridoxal phosphate-dependent transferase [Podospora conica]|nr:pyridoxal phosphate-dependent transferase [Schizothecium conicum]
MVKIPPFEVEQWMDRLETTPGVLNIAETCAASVSIDDLMAMSTDKAAPSPLSLSTKMTYGEIKGSTKLRQNVAAMFNSSALPDTTPLGPDNILITQGAIAANFLLLYTLIGAGDHVICVYPTYQQLYSVPESLGAEVSLWKLKPENDYIPDPTELQSLLKPNTKMIIINNPNNPTGSTTPSSVLSAIVSFAKAHSLLILSDEVYHPLYHSHPSPPPSILAFNYPLAIATGSMSKAFALAGLRLGWIASHNPALLAAAASARDYTTISVSQLDDAVAAYALSPAVLPGLLARNMALARTNLALLDAFVERYKGVVEWVRPTGGTTAFIKFKKGKGGVAVDDAGFVMEVLGEVNVLFMPGKACFGRGEDFGGFVRIGYVSETEVLREGLERLGGFVERKLL